MTPLEDLVSGYLTDLAKSQSLDLLQHAANVAIISSALAGIMGFNEKEIRNICLGGLLHDIGKQFISSSILDKAGSLTEEEYAEVQRHPWSGYQYLNRFVSDRNILQTVLYHHERWDGSGYPYGLKQEEIPLCARICGIADVYDALISERSYRRSAWDQVHATELLWMGAGKLFDPQIMHMFLKMIEEGQPVKSSINSMASQNI
jgi:HD-GYP domain-containing protein (c-di-GMP phosphodiesterase class II)